MSERLEFLTRYGAELAAYYVVAGTLVAGNGYFVDRCLLPFEDTHLHVNGVAIHGHFHRVDPEEQVAIIHIQTADVKPLGVELQPLFRTRYYRCRLSGYSTPHLAACRYIYSYLSR